MVVIEHIIRSCKTGNQAAQKELYKFLLLYLQAVANRYLRDTSYLKDVLQESYIRIFRSLDQYDAEKASLKQWAAKITINVCFNYNKRMIEPIREELNDALHKVPVQPLVLQDLSNESLLVILKKMPKGFFEVFNLAVIDGYSHKEIAEILGISIELSRKRLSRGKSWLRFYFQKKPNLIKKI